MLLYSSATSCFGLTQTLHPTNSTRFIFTFVTFRLRSTQMSSSQEEWTTWVRWAAAVIQGTSIVSKFTTRSACVLFLPASGHQPHRAAHPGHPERRPLQVAARVAQQPRPGPEASHLRAERPDWEEASAGAQQPPALTTAAGHQGFYQRQRLDPHFLFFLTGRQVVI